MAFIQIRTVCKVLVFVATSCWGSSISAAPANTDLSAADKFSSPLNKLIHSSEQNQFAVSIALKSSDLKTMKANTTQPWDLKQHNASVQSHKKSRFGDFAASWC